jgi:predicted ATPase/class 3 adenylate cyclase
MGDLPAGTVTFLFTDIVQSTELVQRLGDPAYAELIVTYRALLRSAFAAHGGREIDTQGDAFFVAFARAGDAVRGALAIQQAIATHRWPPETPLQARIGLHTGAPLMEDGAYVGVDVHRASRICAAGHGGQVLLSQATCGLVADTLPAGVQVQDLGEHHLRDLRRPERIFQLLYPQLPSGLPPLRSLRVQPHNLPMQLTSFIGREREIAEVKYLLGKTRLLTLTGPGGCGKTRLAAQAALQALPAYADGVWLVDLASLTDPALVPSAIAAVVGAREQTGRPPLQTLADTLKTQQLLLILDNCEHLIKACAETADALLRAVAGVTILATSRESLGTTGESCYQVPSLTVPTVRETQSPDVLTKTEAVRLFIERATSVHPGFSPTPAMSVDMARIVQTLDGIPLAIELAAARVNVLSVPQIAERLHDRFHLLTTGSRTAAPRQQTMQATMDWSYDLLSESERVFLRRLSAFAGGFTLDAAEAVCSDVHVPGNQTLDLLTALVNKSLVLAIGTKGDRRYRMLDTVRQYAWDKVHSSGESAMVRDRHLQYFLAFAEQAEAHVRGGAQRQWLDWLDTEHDNLRMALEWAQTKRDDTELKLAGALWLFWDLRGHWKEGRARLQGALARHPDASPALKAKALYPAALLAWRQRDHAQAEALATESLEVCRAIPDEFGMACSLLVLGLVARRKGRFQDAADHHAESLALFRKLKDDWGVAWSLRLLGIAKFYQGEVTASAEHFKENLAISTAQRDLAGIAAALQSLGRIAISRHSFDRATALLKQSLSSSHELGDRNGTAEVLYLLGRVAADQKLHEHALTLFASAAALREMIGAPVPEPDPADYERVLDWIGRSVDSDVGAAAWARGHGMDEDGAVAYAMLTPPSEGLGHPKDQT